MGAEPFDLVFVCTGNRFRSPLAEAVARQALASANARVRSVGTLELGVVGALPEAAAEARRLGLDLSAHRARHLGHGTVTDADLVIGFERTHVALSVVEGGAQRDRTFTLREIVDLVEMVAAPPQVEPVARARELIRRAAAARQAGGLSETPDPLGRGSAFARRTADEVAGLTKRLIDALFPHATRSRAGNDAPFV